MTTTSMEEEDFRKLSWFEHIRLRAGMYIGRCGDGSDADDGIYVMLAAVLNNSIDEYLTGGYGQFISVTVRDGKVKVRDYGRGIPFDKLQEYSSQRDAGEKCGLNSSRKTLAYNINNGTKVVNALSSDFAIRSFRNELTERIEYSKGIFLNQTVPTPTDDKAGTEVEFTPDTEIFAGYEFRDEHVVALLKEYVFLNAGLTINYNGKNFYSENGLADFLQEKMILEPLCPIIRLKSEDIEVAFIRDNYYREELYSFVNGRRTTGGACLSAFKAAWEEAVKKYPHKDIYDKYILSGIVAAISIRIENPVFSSSNIGMLCSKEMSPGGISIQEAISDFFKKELYKYLPLVCADAQKQ